jgi:hypothetical protein
MASLDFIVNLSLLISLLSFFWNISNYQASRPP